VKAGVKAGVKCEGGVKAGVKCEGGVKAGVNVLMLRQECFNPLN